jgi:starch synthase (maltosyl-transferring)
MFQARYVLAALSMPSIGIYGPTYELGINTPREPGSEEYLDSEKYQRRTWDLKDPASIAPLIRRVNQVRREHPALQRNAGLELQAIDNDELIAWSKRTDDRSDRIVTIVSLGPSHVQRGTLELATYDLWLDPARPIEAEDLLTGEVLRFDGNRLSLELDPAQVPARILSIRGQA